MALLHKSRVLHGVLLSRQCRFYSENPTWQLRLLSKAHSEVLFSFSLADRLLWAAVLLRRAAGTLDVVSVWFKVSERETDHSGSSTVWMFISTKDFKVLNLHQTSESIMPRQCEAVSDQYAWPVTSYQQQTRPADAGLFIVNTGRARPGEYEKS